MHYCLSNSTVLVYYRFPNDTLDFKTNLLNKPYAKILLRMNSAIFEKIPFGVSLGIIKDRYCRFLPVYSQESLIINKFPYWQEVLSSHINIGAKWCWIMCTCSFGQCQFAAIINKIIILRYIVFERWQSKKKAEISSALDCLVETSIQKSRHPGCTMECEKQLPLCVAYSYNNRTNKCTVATACTKLEYTWNSTADTFYIG